MSTAVVLDGLREDAGAEEILDFFRSIRIPAESVRVLVDEETGAVACFLRRMFNVAFCGDALTRRVPPIPYQAGQTGRVWPCSKIGHKR